MIPIISAILTNRYAIIAIGFALYTGWVWQHGREFEQHRQASAIAAINTKLKVVNERETTLAMAEDALRDRARGEATAVLTPCIVTAAAEAQALSRIR